jgi:heat shock protein HslJ
MPFASNPRGWFVMIKKPSRRRCLKESRYTWINKKTNSGSWSALSFISILVALFLVLVSPIRANADAALFGTYWLAFEIDGSPINIQSSKWQPFFILNQGGNQLQGFTGCNQLAGSFQQAGDSFGFKELAATRRACPSPVDVLEQSFLRALQATTSVRIFGDILELRDASGQVRVRLRAANAY